MKPPGIGPELNHISSHLSPSLEGDGSIIAPKARDRLLELIEREQLPGDVRDTLAGALSGDLRRQQLLFQAMLDTWPRLQKNITEVLREVKKAPWEFEGWSARGSEPSDEALEKAAFVEDHFWMMKPRPAWGETGGSGLLESLAYGYFAGHQVVELRWSRDGEGTRPRAAKVVSPRFYGYPYDEDGEDRLMFNRDGGFSGYSYEDFPEHHFLLAINAGHPGHTSVAAPLRALTGYWLAATFGLKWLLQFAQLYGVPFRWAEYADESSRGKVCKMLETIGSAGWGAFPSGTKVHFEDASKSASALPQKDLIDMADTQCDIFILGQTLTTSEGNSGSRALGDVHQDMRTAVIQGVADFVADTINQQFIPSILSLNYGTDSEPPCLKARFEKVKNEQSMAERDRILFKEMGIPVSVAWLSDRHGVPIPEEGEKLFQANTGLAPLPREAGDTFTVSARDSSASTIDQLSANVLQDLTGVTQEWLSPVRPFFERLSALAMSKQVSDEDFLEALEKAQREMPELFDRLNVEALESSFTEALGTAVLAGSVNRYER